MFDGDGKQRGGLPDVSVVYADGRYHMVYDWCDPANHCGGLGYAWSDKPQGPFRRTAKPVHDDRTQPTIGGHYVRTYGGTLVRRKADWLIISAMSTPRNAGGTLAQVAMTAQKPEGPWSKPTLLLCPQSDVFHPQIVEFFPAFANQGFVYAPATSVAANRTFQVVFRAPLEEAHDPKAWSITNSAPFGTARPCPPRPPASGGKPSRDASRPTALFGPCSPPRPGKRRHDQHRQSARGGTISRRLLAFGPQYAGVCGTPPRLRRFQADGGGPGQRSLGGDVGLHRPHGPGPCGGRCPAAPGHAHSALSCGSRGLTGRSSS